MSRNILVTRPARQAPPLIKALNEAGFTSIALPLLLIEPIDLGATKADTQLIASTLDRLDSLKGLIFISTNAVDGFFYWLNLLKKELPENLSVLAIGEATGKHLKQHGVAASFSQETASNSEALLALPECQSVNGQHWMIVKGVGGREHLKDVLTQRGAHVDNLPVYRRNVINYANKELTQAVDQNLAFIILTSGESLNQLIVQAETEAVSKQVLAIPTIIPGKRLYQLAVTKGFKSVVRAENASVPAILNVITHKG
ncbi:MAG: uroporphyrinogen-III synthase [Cellvibrionales bacterium]|nr:uroporphyrinogen-III synthase [Cellvibrionales bacterium]